MSSLFCFFNINAFPDFHCSPIVYWFLFVVFGFFCTFDPYKSIFESKNQLRLKKSQGNQRFGPQMAPFIWTCSCTQPRCALGQPRFAWFLMKKDRIASWTHDFFHSRCSRWVPQHWFFETNLFSITRDNSWIEFWLHPTFQIFGIFLKFQERQKYGKEQLNQAFRSSCSWKVQKCGRVAPTWIFRGSHIFVWLIL